MRTIVLNESNLVQDGQNNKLVYSFPNSVLFKNTYVALQSASLYYSWYNISSALGNNTYTFRFPNTSGVMTTRTVVMPDGIYEVKDIDAYFQFYCLQNGYYWTTVTGEQVFFLKFEVNVSLYSIQVCAYSPPYTSSPASIGNPNNYTPAFGTALTATRQTLVPNFPANFTKTIGWPTPNQLLSIGVTTGIWTGVNFANAGTATGTGTHELVPWSWNATTGVVAYSSNNSPQVNPNGSIYISCSNINNPYAIPSTTIYAITPTGVAGSAIVEKPPQFCWNKFIDGTYNRIAVTFLGLDGRPISIRDPQMTILLAIKDGDEYSGKG
jgi:hypothetical protein